MKLSRYVKIFHLSPDTVTLYHTYNKSVVQIPSDAIERMEIDDEQYAEICDVLKEMDYFISDEDVAQSLESLILNQDKLLISLEITLGCNLRCPYCYQADKKHVNNLISDDDLDLLIHYFEIVYQESPFKELNLKILGGEPTIVWQKFRFIYDRTRSFCESKGLDFNILIDTNGILIDDILKLDGYHEMLLTVPLTYKACHDKVRKDARGNGTYDIIIENLNRIFASSKNISVNLRSNIDADNMKYFETYIVDLKDKLIKKPLVTLNYTAEFDTEEQFLTGISYKEFIDWRSTTAIDTLIKYDFPVTVSPILTIEHCQYRSLYSMKIFSDGTCGHCAMAFFSEERESLESVIQGITKKNGRHWQEKQTLSLLMDKECLQCSNLFVCGGAFKLPCMKAIGLPDCRSGYEHNVDITEFLRRYCACLDTEQSDLFEMFNNGLRIR